MKKKITDRKLTGGEAVVESFKFNGVKKVFGLIGSATMEVFDALYDSNSIKFIGVRDERTGVHMADGYARASGKVGLIIAGPSGSTAHIDNLITIAENRKDCVVFASPQRSDVVNVTNSNTQANNVIDFFDNIRSL